jgi:hypothetical protein
MIKVNLHLNKYLVLLFLYNLLVIWLNALLSNIYLMSKAFGLAVIEISVSVLRKFKFLFIGEQAVALHTGAKLLPYSFCTYSCNIAAWIGCLKLSHCCRPNFFGEAGGRTITITSRFNPLNVEIGENLLSIEMNTCFGLPFTSKKGKR